jgi:DNA-binding response OmpR family regulator
MLPAMPRVLLVDDDPAMLRLLQVNFRIEGFETSTATHGEEALEALRADPPDAVVLDLMLPGIDGLEVHRRIRADPALSSIPVVFLTGRAIDDMDAPDGAVFVAKPFDPAVLVAAVRERAGGAP